MLPIVVLFFVVFGFCGILIGVSHFFGAQDSPSKIKKESYECGVPASKAQSSRFPVKFFLTGILFIIFDIEIIFMYPFAISYREFLSSEMAAPILFSVGLFLFLFLFGLWWEIKSKALEWK